MTARGALAKIHIAKKDLGLDDETYRAMLARLTGKTSSRDCSDAQLGLVLDEMKAKGWKPAFKVVARNPGAPTRRGALASSPMARKARAMWISLHQLGVVRDPSEAALESFGRRQLGVEKLQWADQSHGNRLIEALKAMAQRAGWVQAGNDVRSLKEALFAAQEARLTAYDPERMAESDQGPFVSDRELDDRIAENAGHIRAYAARSVAEVE